MDLALNNLRSFICHKTQQQMFLVASAICHMAQFSHKTKIPELDYIACLFVWLSSHTE